ncbi:MAG: ribosome biogenesis GTPase Der [Clostridia bacterium]|nr:ribosome biogenesis GTPase Der [Clostridia bacterium]
MSKKIVAIIGRPNVGKSTFFNLLVGENLSITSDEAGVTRDRILADVEWRGKTFQLVDTGGIEDITDDVIVKSMRRQAELAMDMADVIVFVTDIKSGVTATDIEISQMLRRTNKPVILVCNKVDNVGAPPDDIYELYNLGLGEPYPVSSIAKLGIGEVLDAIYDNFGTIEEVEEQDETISVAIIGKPNVGKSSLTNKILGEERSIVSNVAGTTRDAIDTVFENKYGKYNFIDTAGIRKKNKIYDDIEKYSIIKAKAAIERSDVALIVIDATEGVTEQDEKIAGIAHEKGKALIIVVNKWDLINKDEITLNQYVKKIRENFKFMSYAPIITLSAVTGQRVDKLFELINKVHAANNFRISTGVLNDVIMEAMAIHPAPTDKGKRLKIYYATEVKVAPPTFVLFVNKKELAHFSYLRYLENELRKHFDLEGTPINIIVREKEKKEDKEK